MPVGSIDTWRPHDPKVGKEKLATTHGLHHAAISFLEITLALTIAISIGPFGTTDRTSNPTARIHRASILQRRPHHALDFPHLLLEHPMANVKPAPLTIRCDERFRDRVAAAEAGGIEETTKVLS